MEFVGPALSLVAKIVLLGQCMSRQKGQCQALVEQVSRLGRLLKAIEPSLQRNATPQAKDFLKELNFALEDAARIMEEIKDLGFMASFLRAKSVYEDLSGAARQIQACLGTLSTLQLALAQALQTDIKKLKESLEQVENQLKNYTAYKEERQAITVEVMSILRHGNPDQLDQFLSWFSKRFELDVMTLKTELQEMKENAFIMGNQVKHERASKQEAEEELLEMVILSLVDVEVQEVPGEFTCAICLGPMQDPVILTSGQSYCRACVHKHFEEGQNICPKSRTEVRTDQVIANIGLRIAINRWKQNVRCGRATQPAETLDCDLATVPSIVSRLSSQNTLEVLKNLGLLIQISRTPDGCYSIYNSEGVPVLAKLLDSSMYAEKAAAVLQSMTSVSLEGSSSNPEGMELVISGVIAACLDRLVKVLTTSRGSIRLRAAQTLANILEAPEVVELVRSEPGVIPSLLAIASDTEGKQVCIKVMKCLAKLSDSFGDRALLTALLVLSKSDVPHLIQESLKAFRSSMSSEGVVVLRTTKSVPLLVQKAVDPLEPGHDSSIYILEEVVKHEGGSCLVESGFTSCIPSLVLHYHRRVEEMPLFRSLLRISTACVKLQKEWGFQMESFFSLVPVLLEIIKGYECAEEALSLLVGLCCSKDSTIKELTVERGGIPLLKKLAVSPRSGCRREALTLIKMLLPLNACQDQLSEEADLAIFLRTLHHDPNVDCAAEALGALAILGGGGNDNVKDLMLRSLEPRCIKRLLECNRSQIEAATSLVTLLLPLRNPSAEHLKLLEDVVQHCSEVETKVIAGTALLRHACCETGDGEQKRFDDSSVLSALLALEDKGGGEFQNLLAAFMARYVSAKVAFESGGIPVLLRAVQRQGSRSSAIAAIRKLTENCEACHEKLREAGFWSIVLENLSLATSTRAWSADLAASLAAVYGREGSLASAQVAERLICILEERDNEDPERQVFAAKSLAQFDTKHMAALAKTGTVLKALLELVPSQSCLELIHLILEQESTRDVAVEVIVKDNGIPPLLCCLNVADHRVQGLVIDVLLQLGALCQSEELQSIMFSSMVSGGVIEALLKILSEHHPYVKKKIACLIANLISSRPAAFLCKKREAAAALVQALVLCSNDADHVCPETTKFVVDSISAFLYIRDAESSCDDVARKALVYKGCAVQLLQALKLSYGTDLDNEIRTSALRSVKKLMENERQGTATLSLVMDAAFNVMASDECKRLGVQLLVLIIQNNGSRQQVCRDIVDNGYVQLVCSLKKMNFQIGKDVEKLLDMLKKYDRKRVIEIEKAYSSSFSRSYTESSTR